MLAESLGLLAAASAGFMAYAVRGRSSPCFGPAVWRGPASEPAIALTFDDGPSESTPFVLELLQRHGAQATFFQCGANVVRLPAIARDVVAAGHAIGNHTFSHPLLSLRPGTFIEQQIHRTQTVLAESTGVVPSLFRAPYGVRWFGLSGVLSRHGLTHVLWSAMASDWRLPADRVLRKLRARACPGAIFCLHDGRELTIRPDIGSTLEALRRLVPDLQDRGFRLVTVPQLLWLKTSPNA